MLDFCNKLSENWSFETHPVEWQLINQISKASSLEKERPEAKSLNDSQFFKLQRGEASTTNRLLIDEHNTSTSFAFNYVCTEKTANLVEDLLRIILNNPMCYS